MSCLLRMRSTTNPTRLEVATPITTTSLPARATDSKNITQKCTTNVNAGLAFDGQAGVMLLSKFPHEDRRRDDLEPPRPSRAGT